MLVFTALLMLITPASAVVEEAGTIKYFNNLNQSDQS